MKIKHLLTSLILALCLLLSAGRDALTAPPRANVRRELALSLEREEPDLTGSDTALYLGSLPVTNQPIENQLSSRGNSSESLPEGAWDKIQAQLRRSSYELALASDAAGGYQATNQAHGLRFSFGEDGVGVTLDSPSFTQRGDAQPVPSGAPGDTWRWNLTFSGYGYEGDVQPIDTSPTQIVTGNRIKYQYADHASRITEWYINDEHGLEQGFTLQSPPPLGSSSTGLLVLEMALDTTLTPHLADEGQSILFQDETGQTILRYADLYVYDATGKQLSAHLAIRNSQLAIRIDDENAVYPLTIDPLLTSQVVKLTASDGADGDAFGYSVAVSGDTVVIGATADDDNGSASGSAYVFERNQTGADNWGQVVKLTASDGAASDQFGRSVAISGDTVVVGAFYDDDNGSDSGSAYVFGRNQGGADNWGQVVKLTASDGAADDHFGESMTISGDTVVIGASTDDDNGSDSGSAYVFGRNQGGADNWGQVVKLTASDGAADDYFGYPVAISGDTVVVGAHYDDDNGDASGSAYVFERNQGGDDNWGQVVKLTASDGAASDWFGKSVSISGDTVVVGASLDDDNAPEDSGSAYVFERNQTGADNWGQVVKLTASDAAASDRFGGSVAISGDTVIVGAALDDDNGADSGSAYVFERNQTGADNWGQVDKLLASDGAAGDGFGGAVAISGNTIVISAYMDDNIGSAYTFVRSGDTWLQMAKPTASDGAAYDYFGYSVVISGDTVVVGARGDDDNGTDSGSAYVFERNQSGADLWGQVAKLTAADAAGGDEFGWSVAISGDTVVVGAQGDDDNGTDSGSAYVFERNQDGADLWGQVAKLTASDGAADDHFGFSVAISGDTVVVGADDDDSASGSAYVFERNQTGADNWGQVAKLTASDATGGDQFGWSVTISGDTAVVGAQADDDNGAESGSAYVFERNQGGADLWGQVAKLTASDAAADDHFGWSIAISRDTVVVGAWGNDDNGAESGSAYVFERNQGGADLWGQVAKLTASDAATSDHFGWSVAISGGTVVVAAYQDDDNGSASGSAYVFERNQGGADNWGQAAKLLASDGAAFDIFGISVAISGDTVVVGAYADDDNGLSSGSAYVYQLTQSQQVTLDSSTPAVINVPHTVTATVIPLTAATPITYVWQATGQSPVTHTTSTLVDTATFLWSPAGIKVITVTAINTAGVFTDVYSLTVRPPLPDAADILLFDHLDGANLAQYVGGTVTYVDGPPGLGQAANFVPGGWLRYAVSGWTGDYPGRLEMWVYPKEYNTGLVNFNWNQTTSPPAAGYVLHFQINAEGKLIVGVWGGSGTPPVGTSIIPLNQWTHIAYTWGTDGSRLYVNGVLDGYTPDNTYPALNPTTYVYVPYWGNPDLGYIDELLIAKHENNTFYITGQITDGVNPIPDVTVSVDGGIKAVTNASGYYTITGLLSNTWTLTPSKPAHTFAPVTRSVSVTTADVSGQDFTVVYSPTNLTLAGPTTGLVNTTYSFTATVNLTATLPLTYVWEATSQSPVTHTASLSHTDTVTFTWPTTGSKTITVTAVNGMGSVTDTTTVTIDKTDTATAITGDAPDPSAVGQSYTVTATVTSAGGTPTGAVDVDDGEGNSCQITLSSGTGSCSLTSTSAGAKTLTADYGGDANFNPSSDTESHSVNQADTATAITGDAPDPSAVGQSYTVTATVTSAGGTPTGAVDVDDGEGNSCQITLSSGTGSCSLTSTSAGAKTLTADYGGDANFNPSSDTESHSVNQADTATAITGDAPDPSAVGQSYTVTATVTSAGGTPTGVVDVDDGEGNSCQITLSSGSGSCSLTSTSAGVKTITADYGGDANFNTSSDTEGHTVNQANSSTTITSDAPDPSVVGQSYTVDVTVAAVPPGAGTPSGTVDVDDGEGNSCQITLASGTGSCSLSSTSAGAKTLTADYGGDANFNTSSDTEGHTVNQANSSTTITSDAPDPSVVGQSYTVDVTVAAVPPGAGTPSGTVDVDDGEGNSCQITLASGTGSCSLSSTSAGAKTLTADYGGDANFNPSSDTEAHTVNQADTTTTITADAPDPSAVGQSYTVTATVTSAGGTPTGVVDVDDGDGNGCQITLSSGTGSCSLTSTSAGAKTLTADYGGDADFNTSSDTEAHTVNKADTTTTITHDEPDPSAVGQSYTVTATVTSAGGTPTGVVDVDDGEGNSCQITLSSGSGSCSLTSTSAGAKTLTADYGGDANFNTSSDTEGHTVNQANSSTTITSDAPDPSVVGHSYTVDVTVAAVPPGAGTPSGTVDVDDGEGNSCQITLASGTGSCSLSSTSAGAKTLTADYGGDANFNPSSDTEAHTVNQADTTTTITADAPDPSAVGQSYTVTATVTSAGGTPTGVVDVDDGDGNGCQITLSSGTGSCSLTSTSAGAKTLTADYGGDADFNTSSDTEAHTVNKADTTTTITHDEPDPSVVGQSYTVTATVTSAGGTPTGAVDVDDGEGNSCQITLSSGTGSCSLTSTSAGAKTLTADYGGDANFNPSSDTESHSVNQADTATAITGDAPDPSAVGQSYTVTATVTSAGGTPTGVVDVDDGEGNSCQITLSSGSGSCSLTSTSAGVKTITADYGGDANFNPSSDTESHTVNQADTATTITSDAPDPSVVGQSYTVDVTVAAVPPGAGTPSGTVDVDDGEGNSCQITLASGTGSCSLSSTSAGAKTLTADYGGDANFNPSSDTESHSVNQADTATAITGDAPDPSAVGQSYTVTATVTSAGGTPTGVVDVDDGEGNSCQITLSSGSGSCSLTSTSAGAKTLTADYGGDANFNTSSDTEGHTVNQANSSTTITSDAPDPSLVGQSYTVTATVTSAGGTPTGAVDIDDGTGANCQITLSGGSGSCSLVSTSPGLKTLTADYNGDANFNPSSDTEGHTVNRADSSATITSDAPDPSVVGQSYTVDVTVAAVPPGAGTPTGAVDIDDGTGANCQITLSGGSGSCSLASTSPGLKTLTADYNGDANFNPSSDTEGHTVNRADSSATITSDAPDPSVVGQSYTVDVTVAAVPPGAGTPSGTVDVDDGTGANCQITLSGGSGSCSLASTSPGLKTLTADYNGDANFNPSSDTEGHTVNQANSTTTITSDAPDPSLVGQSYTVDVTVAALPPGAGTPGGTVDIDDGTGANCQITLSGGTGSCSLTSTSAGTKTLTADYGGDANFNTSSDTEAHTVNQADTTTTITGDTPDPSVVGQSYTVTATVTSAGGTPTGVVDIDDGTGANCQITLSGGTGSCSLTSTSAGTKTLTADYGGDANFNTSSDTEAHTVNQADTTTTITGDTPDPSVVGQSYTVTATVTSAGGTPTGVVDVDDGDGNSCQITLSSGTGSCSLSSTSAEAKTLTADYGGDANFNPSSDTESHSVNQANTTTTITADTPDPSAVGQSYTVTATVTSAGGTPTGVVDVDDGDGNSCQITLSSGTGSCSLSSTSAGAKTLTADYGGDANFNPSSDTEAHTVNQADTTTTITADTPDPSVVGQSYTVTATVTSAGGTPTGVVDVDDGDGNSCQITLSSGTGSCSLASTSAGAKTLTADYGGDANFNPSSDTEAHTVDKADTATAITSDAPDPSGLGEAVPVQWSVTVSAPGSGTPGSTVTVTASTGESCSAVVGAGQCNITFNVIGTRNLTATYSGDSNFNTSRSSAVAHNVTAAYIYTLTVSKSGNGSGTVTSNPTGIACGTTCRAGFTDGTAVTLTVVADSGSTFAGWSGPGCGGTGTCQVTMTETKQVTATFTQAAGQPGYGSTPVPGSSIDVGTAGVGRTVSTTLTISETGEATLVVTPTLSGADAGDFGVAPSTLTIFDGGAAQDLSIECTPSVAGTLAATLTVAHNAPGSPGVYSLSCTGKPHYIYLPLVLKNS